MEIFKIEIQEFLTRVVEIEANSINDAISIIKEKYINTEIVLNYDDFVEVNFVEINSEGILEENNKIVN